MLEKNRLQNIAAQLAAMLFLPKGRINRTQFAAGLALFILVSQMAPGKGAGQLAFLAFMVLQLYLGYSIFGKRLHDIGKSAKGFVVAAICAVLAANVLYPYIVFQRIFYGNPLFGNSPNMLAAIPPGLVVTAVIVFWLGMIAYLFSKRGEEKVNEYGAPPHSGLLSAPAGSFAAASDETSA